MPPPTLNDPWLASRRFGIVIDAGSSGSRLQVYSWKDARAVKDDVFAHESDTSLLEQLPRVEKGVQSGDGWLYKVEPGLSSFGNDPTAVWDYLAPLLAYAQDIIPPSLHHETPLFLLATAGMRLLDPHQQQAVIEATCMFFRSNSNFRLESSSNLGPCGSSIRIISGEEEGLFGWIAVNYLMDGFSSHEQNHRASFGFLDMGGASTQIAFEPSASEKLNLSKTTADSLVEVRLRLLGGEEIQHKVFVTTWLGYGTNQARERYLGQEVEEWDAHSGHSVDTPIPDPCLPKDLVLNESPVPDNSPLDSHSRKPHHFIGTGSFPQCVKETAPLLNKTVPCPDNSCLFNGVPAPKIDFSLSKFIGVSEYWYSSEHVFGLGGAYDYVEYERAASQFCAREWSDIVDEHSRTKQYLDGTIVEENGEAFRWGKEVGLNRLQMQCFKAAWITNVLHEGIGMPRIVDPGGNRTSHEVDDANNKAHDKNLGEIVKPLPTFQSVDTIGETAISWTLGKIVLEASKEVPATSGDHVPLSDPDPHGHGLAEEQLALEGQQQRGMSLKTAFPAMLVLLGVLYVLFRVVLRVFIRRSKRRVDGEENIGLFDYYSSEENGTSGYFSSSSASSPPNTPASLRKASRGGIIRSIRRLLRSFTGHRRPRRPKSRSNATKPRMTIITRPSPNHHHHQHHLQHDSSPTGPFFKPAPPQRTRSHGDAVSASRRPASALSLTSSSPRGSAASSRISPSRTFSGNFLSRPNFTSASLPTSVLSSRVSSSDSEGGDDSPDDYAYGSEPGTARPAGMGMPPSASSRSSLQLPYAEPSRNSSQVNLTTATPRTLTMTSSSRTGTTPTNATFANGWSTDEL